MTGRRTLVPVGLRSALAVLAGVAAAAGLFALAGPAAALRPLTSDGRLLDTMWTGYSPDVVYRELDRYGEVGRGLYRAANTVDFAFALTYASGLALALRLLLPQIRGPLGRGHTLVTIPLAAGAADLAEGVLLRATLELYPARVPDAVISLASVLTVTKWALASVAVLVVIACLGVLGAQQLADRKA